MLLETWTRRSESAPSEKIGEAILRRTLIGTLFRAAEAEIV
jgi:hypothetical protein